MLLSLFFFVILTPLCSRLIWPGERETDCWGTCFIGLLFGSNWTESAWQELFWLSNLEAMFDCDFNLSDCCVLFLLVTLPADEMLVLLWGLLEEHLGCWKLFLVLISLPCKGKDWVETCWSLWEGCWFETWFCFFEEDPAPMLRFLRSLLWSASINTLSFCLFPVVPINIWRLLHAIMKSF